jgi:hypothetical protein
VAVATRADADREHRLDPVRWPLARRGLLPRVVALAALILAAVALLHPGGSAGTCSDRSAPGPGPPAAPSDGVPSDGVPSDRVPSDRVPSDRAPASTGPPRLPGGTVGVAVTPADPAILGVLRAGDRVDLLTVRPGGGPTTLASGALVLATPRPAEVGGGALYLALTPASAREVVGLPTSARFAVLVRP